MPSSFKPLNAFRDIEAAAPLAEELSLTPVRSAEVEWNTLNLKPS